MLGEPLNDVLIVLYKYYKPLVIYQLDEVCESYKMLSRYITDKTLVFDNQIEQLKELMSKCNTYDLFDHVNFEESHYSNYYIDIISIASIQAIKTGDTSKFLELLSIDPVLMDNIIRYIEYDITSYRRSTSFTYNYLYITNGDKNQIQCLAEQFTSKYEGRQFNYDTCTDMRDYVVDSEGWLCSMPIIKYFEGQLDG